MAKRKSSPLLKDYFLITLFFILWVLIKTGDGVLRIFHFLTLILRILGDFFQFYLRRINHFVLCFLRKINRFALSFLRRIRLLAKEAIFLSLAKKLKLKISALRLPSLPKRRGRPKKKKIIFPPPSIFKIHWFLLGFLTAFFFLFLPMTFYFWTEQLPNPNVLAHRDIPQTTKIYDREGNLLYQIYASQNRTLVPLSEIPDYLKKATIAIEDKDFYRHQGFNALSILRAVKENLINRRLQGGSTITQQLVKSALLTPEISLSRKIKEVVLATWAERIYKKDQILEMYLNQVPFGGTAWGVEAASETYFGKPVKDLTLAESALLAGLPAAPTHYSPFGARPELAKARQAEVLRRMKEEGFITSDEAEKAKEQELSFAPQRTDIKAPHFVMYVKELLVQKYGERLVEQGGLKVTTSLDLKIQEMAAKIVKTEVEKLSSLWVGNGATLITKPATGEILAMVGSKDYFDTLHDGNVNVTLALRQPGSAIKVVNYAAALQSGFTPATILDDSPITYRIPGSLPYSPVNYDGQFHGKVPLRYALGNSYNVPAVKVLARVGVKKMIEQGKKMGITTWEQEERFGLSLTLGGGEVTMLDMAKVFGTLGNLGEWVELNPILEIRDYKGEVIEKDSQIKKEAVVAKEIAFLLSHILADNQARSAAFGPNSLLVIPQHTVSVKTGTTNDKRDNWTIGYTPSFVVVTWVGNNNNSPMHPTLASGVTGAAPIWNKIMTNLLEDKEDEPLIVPEGITSLPCFGRIEYFIKGTEPKGGCAPLPTPSPRP